MERICYEVRAGSSLVLAKKFAEGWYSMTIHDMEAVETGPRIEEIIPMWYDNSADYLPDNLDGMIANIIRSDCKAIYGDFLDIKGDGRSPVFYEAVRDDGVIYCLSKSDSESIITTLNEGKNTMSAYRIADPTEIKDGINDFLDIRLTNGTSVSYNEVMAAYSKIVQSKIDRYVRLVRTWWETELSHEKWLEWIKA